MIFLLVSFSVCETLVSTSEFNKNLLYILGAKMKLNFLGNILF
jgi:hypothetical protein